MNLTQTATMNNHTLANLTPKQRTFLEYFYVNIYDPTSTTNIWIPNIGISSSEFFHRTLVRSICKKFGYSGTIQWIVRKQFGRRGDRGLYNIPEIRELHELWECSVIDMTIKTYNGQEIKIKRANNKAF